MADCIDLNCPAFAAQVLSDCGEVSVGGADAVIFIACNTTVTDPSDEVEINALITAGTAEVFKNLKIGIDAPSPIEIDPVVACGPAKTINYERSGTYEDWNINAGNITAYADVLSGRSFGGLIIRECEGRVTYINAEVTFQGGRVIPNNNNEGQRIEASFKWKSKVEPTIHAEPAGIF